MTYICDAIRENRIITFNYKGSLQMAEPHLYGVNLSGDETLSAWRLSGGDRIGFRDFHVSKLSGLAIIDLHFGGPRPGYNPSDRKIARVICRL